jgi:hypothetical protein
VLDAAGTPSFLRFVDVQLRSASRRDRPAGGRSHATRTPANATPVPPGPSIAWRTSNPVPIWPGSCCLTGTSWIPRKFVSEPIILRSAETSSGPAPSSPSSASTATPPWRRESPPGQAIPRALRRHAKRPDYTQPRLGFAFLRDAVNPPMILMPYIDLLRSSDT